jgi:hypothetical protein
MRLSWWGVNTILIDNSIWQGGSINILVPLSTFSFFYLVIHFILLYLIHSPAFAVLTPIITYFYLFLFAHSLQYE